MSLFVGTAGVHQIAEAIAARKADSLLPERQLVRCLSCLARVGHALGRRSLIDRCSRASVNDRPWRVTGAR